MAFDPKLATAVVFAFATPPLIMFLAFAAASSRVRGGKAILLGIPLLWAGLLAVLVAWVGSNMLFSVFGALLLWILIRHLRR